MQQFDILKTWIQARIKSDRGASLVEYALLVALIAVVCIVAISFLGDKASEEFSSVGSSLKATPAGVPGHRLGMTTRGRAHQRSPSFVVPPPRPPTCPATRGVRP